MAKASPALEAFIKESIERSRAAGYYPTTFQAMQDRYETIEAIRRCVESGEQKTGYRLGFWPGH
jgi:hypothetical protein